MELLDIVLITSLMTFDKEYFQHFFSSLHNLYLAMLEEELKKKCFYDKIIKWPTIFQRCMEFEFGIMEGNKKYVKYWIDQFNTLRKTITSDKWFLVIM